MSNGKLHLLIVVLLFTNALNAQDTLLVEVNRVFYEAEQKVTSLVEEVGINTKYPRSINPDGTTRLVDAWDWTSGFFPGTLWYMYENTGVENYKINAEHWTASIESQKTNTGTHDLGFMLYCSFGNGLRLVSPSNYSDILITTANSLMTRVDPTVGCMKSWDWAKQWEYPVIIDNMMNLEILFWASKQTGDSKYYDAAVAHANTTIINHFRPDNSSYHVVDYNKSDGTVRSKETHQGYNDESDWARGQAWGLYGFTMTYRETKNTVFLEQAEKIASFIMNHSNMPSDKIPYWDLKDPKISSSPTSVPRDVSVATVIASALIELSQYADEGSKYMIYASDILNTLSQPKYTTDINSSNNFILLKSTGNWPSNSEINTSINYADYYYLEALTRYKNIMKVDFEPYTVYTDSKTIDENTEFVDYITIYDIDNIGGFTVSLKDNPSFVILKKLSDSKFEIIAKPTSSDVGNHRFNIYINYKDGTVVEKEVTYDVTSSLGNDDFNSTFKVYNTAEELVISGDREVYKITILTILGSTVLSEEVELTGNKASINISDLSKGIYVYVLETSIGVTEGKFIVR